MARFSKCAVVSNWLPHTPVQIFFVSFWCIKQFGAHFPFKYTNWSFGLEFLYNSSVRLIFRVEYRII